jgi:CDP-paratose 2-epimerase
MSGRSRANGAQSQGTVLIIGGAGFIGSNLAYWMLQHGRRVRLFDNLSRPGTDRNLRWLKRIGGPQLEVQVADTRDLSAVRRAVREVDQVFHLAAQVAVTLSVEDPRLDFEVNLRGTLNVLEAIRSLENPPPLLFTSTNKVYGDLSELRVKPNRSRYEPEDPHLKSKGIAEDRPLQFLSPYGCSKGAADQYVLDYAQTFGLKTVVFRMSCIYGPRQFGTEDQGWVAHFLIQSIRGQPLVVYGDGMQVRDILYIDDLVRAFVLAQESIERLSGKAFNIGGGPQNTLSLLELLDLIERISGRRPEVRLDKWRVGDQRYYVSDTRRFQAATGWSPSFDVAAGIARLHTWLERALLEEDLPRPRLDYRVQPQAS